jgi:phage tail protein X
MEFKRYKGYSPDELRKKPAGPVANNTPDRTDLVAAMKARMATAAHFGNPSAQRMVSPNPPIYPFTGNEGVGVPAGETGTHFMGSMDNYAVPFIQQGKSGKMQFVPNASPENREAIKFRTPEEARYFAEHYKDIAPMSNQYAWGGPTNKDGKPTQTPFRFPTHHDGEKIAQHMTLPETTVFPNGQYPRYDSLTNEQKKYWDDKGPIGRHVRGLATDGYRGMQDYDRIGHTAMKGLGVLGAGATAGVLAAGALPAIGAMGAALPGAMSASLPGMSAIPGATAGNALWLAGAYNSAKEMMPNSETDKSFKAAIKDPSLNNILNATGNVGMASLGFIGLEGTNIAKAIPSVADDLARAGKYLTTQTPLKNASKVNPFALQKNEVDILHRWQADRVPNFMYTAPNSPAPQYTGRWVTPDKQYVQQYMKIRPGSGNFMTWAVPKNLAKLPDDAAQFVGNLETRQYEKILPLNYIGKSQNTRVINNPYDKPLETVDDVMNAFRQSGQYVKDFEPHWLTGYGSKTPKIPASNITLLGASLGAAEGARQLMNSYKGNNPPDANSYAYGGYLNKKK